MVSSCNCMENMYIAYDVRAKYMYCNTGEYPPQTELNTPQTELNTPPDRVKYPPPDRVKYPSQTELYAHPQTIVRKVSVQGVQVYYSEYSPPPLTPPPPPHTHTIFAVCTHPLSWHARHRVNTRNS